MARMKAQRHLFHRDGRISDVDASATSAPQVASGRAAGAAMAGWPLAARRPVRVQVWVCSPRRSRPVFGGVFEGVCGCEICPRKHATRLYARRPTGLPVRFGNLSICVPERRSNTNHNFCPTATDRREEGKARSRPCRPRSAHATIEAAVVPSVATSTASSRSKLLDWLSDDRDGRHGTRIRVGLCCQR